MKTSNPLAVISRRNFLRIGAVGAPLLPAALLAQPNPSPAVAEPSVDLGNLRAFVELARSDIRTQKALLIAENIGFTPDEAIDFWPLHRQYETDLNKLLDEPVRDDDGRASHRTCAQCLRPGGEANQSQAEVLQKVHEGDSAPESRTAFGSSLYFACSFQIASRSWV